MNRKYIKQDMTESDYKELSTLMRSLMVKWKEKDTNKIVKEISMPDMIDIICNHNEVIKLYDFIPIYWNQINEPEDTVITNRIYKALDSYSAIVWNLCGCEEFTCKELGDIIRNYIDSAPVVYI